MRKGMFATRALTLLLAMGMMSQNVATVYAAEDGDPTPTSESEYTITYTVEDAAQGSVGLNKSDAEKSGSVSETVTEAVTTNEDQGSDNGDSGEGEDITITYAVADGQAEYGSLDITSATYNTKDGVETIKGATATAAAGYRFAGWKQSVDGDYICTGAQLSLTTAPTADVTYTAYFEVDTAAQEADVPMLVDDTPAVVDGKAYVKSTAQEYDTLGAAMSAAAAEDVIYLGRGKYYGTDSQSQKGAGAGKSLTFVGSSTSDTVFEIQNEQDYTVDRHANYAFDGSESIAFENLTLQTPGNQYDSGFVRVKHITLNNCVFNGRGDYWGTETTTFKNVTFNPQDEITTIWGISINKNDYSVYTKTGNTYTFENCKFNSKGGKAVKVFKDGASGNDTIYFKNCVVENGFGLSTKQILCIDDRFHNVTIYISGGSSISGNNVPVDSISCSRLYGFGSDKSCNTGKTTVYIEGNQVFAGGKLIDHEHGAISDGSYSNNVAQNSYYAYSEGYKDNAYKTTEGDWVTDETTGLVTREIVKTCKYCGWSSKTMETQKETKDLPGDLLVDNDTEHDKIYSVKQGQTVSLTGALQVSAVQQQMADVESAFKNLDGTSIALSNISYGFTAAMTVPEGVTLPATIDAQAEGLADTYKVDSTEVSDDGKTVTVQFALTDDAKSTIKTYADLKSKVDAAGTDGWIRITIPGVTIDQNVAAGKILTVTGTVGGTFSATATSQYGTARSFSYEWSGKQWADGKDAAATDDSAIQLSMEVAAPETPVTPEDEPRRRHNGSSSQTVTPAQVSPIAIEEAGSTDVPAEIEPTPEVQEIEESGSIPTSDAGIQTGDDSMMVLYGILFLMATAGLVFWTRKGRA